MPTNSHRLCTLSRGFFHSLNHLTPRERLRSGSWPRKLVRQSTLHCVGYTSSNQSDLASVLKDIISYVMKHVNPNLFPRITAAARDLSIYLLLIWSRLVRFFFSLAKLFKSRSMVRAMMNFNLKFQQ